MVKEYLNIKDVADEVLNNSAKAREDDFYLIGAVLERMGVDVSEPFCDVMLNHNNWGVPAFETITRRRRVHQALYPQLYPDIIKKQRKTAEDEAREMFGLNSLDKD